MELRNLPQKSGQRLYFLPPPLPEPTARAAEKKTAAQQKPFCQRHINSDQSGQSQQQAAADQQPVGSDSGGMAEQPGSGFDPASRWLFYSAAGCAHGLISMAEMEFFGEPLISLSE